MKKSLKILLLLTTSCCIYGASDSTQPAELTFGDSVKTLKRIDTPHPITGIHLPSPAPFNACDDNDLNSYHWESQSKKNFYRCSYFFKPETSSALSTEDNLRNTSNQNMSSEFRSPFTGEKIEIKFVKTPSNTSSNSEDGRLLTTTPVDNTH